MEIFWFFPQFQQKQPTPNQDKLAWLNYIKATTRGIARNQGELRKHSRRQLLGTATFNEASYAFPMSKRLIVDATGYMCNTARA